MTGRITIKLGGVDTPLVFGMFAVEKFGTLQAIGDSSWGKLISDLIYSGYYNNEVVNGRNPAIAYGDMLDAIDDLIINQDPVISEVYKCFEESKSGGYLLAEVKKKLENLQSN